ncbi:hypothetical protein OOK27_45240 [Streptomyces canus]|uniref:hypothetical protein n=1 Tax=Streptomyces canus TaxID=58343 RepID=UPI00225A61D1|nr:hypothetical protein [Streptomyces canus]MCX5261274.1 hypothetical protein [Streptomyces canus]
MRLGPRTFRAPEVVDSERVDVQFLTYPHSLHLLRGDRLQPGPGAAATLPERAVTGRA